MGKKFRKNISGLKKWNKIVSILVKDYKKKGETYDIKEVRKLASSVYKDFREVTPSKLKVTDVKKSAKRELTIEAVDVPSYWFDNQQNFTYWFQVGEWANRFANAYPTIPVMLITKATQKNPLVVQGATGDYDGSVFQRWAEDLRDSLENPNESANEEIGYFFGTPAYKDSKGQIYAVWFEDGVKIPKIPPKPEEIEPRKSLLIEEREGIEKKRREIEKPKKKRGRPKKSEEEKKKLPLPKKDKKPIKKEEKPQANRVTEIRNLIADLRQDLKDGLITKKFYQEQVSLLTSKLENGGLI
jgi:hypothetical protein